MNFAVGTEWRLAMSGSVEAIRAAGKKPIWPIGGPSPARPGSGLTRPAGSGQARSARISTGRARFH